MCILRVINDAPNQTSDYDMAVHALQMAEKCDKRELGIGGVKNIFTPGGETEDEKQDECFSDWRNSFFRKTSGVGIIGQRA